MIDNLMWVVTGIAIIGNILNIQMNKWGFVIWGVSNMFFATYNIYKVQYAQGMLFIFYVVTCIIGFIKWHNKEKKEWEERKIESKVIN